MENIVKSVKEDASKLLLVINALLVVWPSNELTILSVLVQNLAFNRSNTVGFDWENEYTKMKAIKKAILQMAEYNNYHTTAFIAEEISMFFDAAVFIEADDKVV